MKKIKLILSLFLAVLFAIIVISCKKNTAEVPETLQEPNLPATPFDYSNKHAINSNLATLGRVLFYDKNLSGNNAISCGSCHKQEFAFADNVRVNKGFNGQELKRNSPSIQGIKGFITRDTFQIVNGSWTRFPISTLPGENNQLKVLLFWDGRQKSLSDMVLNPVTNHNEMNLSDFETLIQKLYKTSYYPDLFEKAYGTKTITKEKIAFALEGFISCLNTPKDSTVVLNNNFHSSPAIQSATVTNITNLADAGEFLFHNKYNCAKCHDPNNHTTTSNPGSYGTVTDPSLMFNIGLDEVYTDQGLGAITGKAGDKGLFKVPTLKNISLTAPYMHDGRFATLGDVIDHYSHNIKPNENLTAEFLNFDGTPKKLNIAPAEKQALIAFLNTLKDEDFLTSPMYSDPFKK